MPRSKLLDALFRMAKDHRTAERHDVSVQTVADWRAQKAEVEGARGRAGLSRRGFLLGAGAATAAMMIPRPARAAKQPTIAVVGGGIAGLSCALQLADAGLSSTVYEASTRIGGRMHSNTTYWNDGQVSEWCGELIDTNHNTVQALARRFHLNLTDLKGAAPNAAEDTFFFGGQYYTRADANDDFQAVHHELQLAVQAASYPTTFDTSTPAGVALDNTSIYDWIEQHVPGGHGSPMGQLLDVAYLIEYGADTRNQSALNLIYLLGYNPKPGNFEMFGKSDERYHIIGGNGQLPAAIAGALGSSVKTGYVMKKIVKGSDGRFTMSFDVGNTTKSVTADYVVLTLPFAVLRDLDYGSAGFDALKDTAIQDLGMGRNGKLQLQFSSRFWNQQGPWGISNGNLYSDTGFQAGWDVSRGQAGNSGIIVDYTGGGVTTSMSTKAAFAELGTKGVDTDAKRFLNQLEPVWPGAKARWNGKATSSLPHLDPNLKCSYSFWSVGQCSAFGGYERVRQGNCLFAGEHTSIDFQGYMEGGALTGQDAANQIIKDLK